MNGLISVIIPVYNVENYLQACMEGVLNQTYANIEIIMVDDGSTDNSGFLCDEIMKMDHRIEVYHKKNGGLSDARNYGINVAHGDYIVFIDSDDRVSVNLIEYLYSLININNAEIGICDIAHFYPNHDIIFAEEKKCHIYDAEDAIAEMFYQKTFLVSACGKIYKKDFFSKLRFPCGMLFEDSAIMYKLFEQAKTIVYGDAKLYGYMHREGSITTCKFTKRDCDIIAICNEITEYMDGRNEKLIQSAAAYRATASLRIYMNAPRNGQFDKEIQSCEEYLKDNAKTILNDKNIRNKLKYALLLYKFARPFMPIIYKRINRWK